MDVASDAFEARLQQALVAFRAIPPKPPKPSSKRKQAVATLFDEITRLKTQGYDFEELREFVIEHAEVEMSVGTLRKYWSAERRQRQGKKPQRKRATASTSDKQPLQASQSGKPSQSQPKAAPKAPEPPAEEPPITAALEPEPETQAPEAEAEALKVQDDYWTTGNWGDRNPPAGGLLNERKFNVIERD